MGKKSLMALAAIIFSLGCILSCGLESVPYLGYVPDESVDITDIRRVTVNLPSTSAPGYDSTTGFFTNFIIFYRIYISKTDHTAKVVTAQDRSNINPVLNSDYAGILPMTDKSSTTINTTNLETYFFGRNYYQLTLVGASIDNVLSRGSLSGTLDISFEQTQGNRPTLSLNGGTYILQRANSGPAMNFSPLPDNRYFFNDPELYDSANITRERNADVVNLSGNDPSSFTYTYVSMYIAAVGQDYLTTVYSQPTYLGILKLPFPL